MSKLRTGRESQFSLTPLCCSVHAFSELNVAHLQWGGECTLWIQMSISSRNNLTDLLRTFNQISGHLFPSQVDIKLTITPSFNF